MNKLKRFVVVEQWDITENTILEAENKDDAMDKLREDEEHNGDIINCYETSEPLPLPQEKKYLARFKIYNGDATYTMPVKTEAKNLKQATEYFKDYECDNNVEIWKLEDVVEIDSLGELWRYI